MKKQDYNAVLEEWSVGRMGTSTLAYGKIYGDDAKRFNDGEAIKTSSVLSPAPFFEGNIIQTRNTRYLLGKRAGTAFDDGHIVQNSGADQIASLRGYMSMRGYNLVYTDSSVFFRLKDPLARTPNNQVSFRTAVVWHNKAERFTAYDANGELRFYDKPSDMVEFRKIRKVKLQVTGNRIIVQSHKVSLAYPAHEVVGIGDMLREYQQRHPVDINALVDSL